MNQVYTWIMCEERTKEQHVCFYNRAQAGLPEDSSINEDHKQISQIQSECEHDHSNEGQDVDDQCGHSKEWQKFNNLRLSLMKVKRVNPIRKENQVFYSTKCKKI